LDLSALIDREREQEALRDLLERPGPSMAVLYGRRRVGKTFLLHMRFHHGASSISPHPMPRRN
jgi:AAA+ ATPase superfamily predicted ATPase